jgi:hypothetical protein
MLAILPMIILSCENDEKIEMRVNHYQQPVSDGNVWYLGLNVQEGDEIGKDEWHYFYDHIAGFEYELGYVYDIEVQKKHVNTAGMMDGSSVDYSLVRVISKTKVPEETTFDIRLTIKYGDGGYSQFIAKDSTSNYYLLEETEIDCGDLRESLEEYLEDQAGLVGTFTHVNDKKIRLVDLKTQVD